MKALLLAVMISCVLVTVEMTCSRTGALFANALLLSIAHDGADSGPDQAAHFIVTFGSAKSEDLTFILGTLVGCGTAPSKTSAVTPNLTEASGRRRHLLYLGDGPPYQGGCAGKIEPFIVVLHPGESLSLQLDLGKYLDLSDSKEYVQARFPAGNYLPEAELRSDTMNPTLKTRSAWLGRVASNTTYVQFGSEFGAPTDDYSR